jgi:hypothetical protein
MVRVAAGVVGAQADAFEHGAGTRLRGAGASPRALIPQRLAERCRRRSAGVERAVGVLEDHLDAAAERGACAVVGGGDVGAVDQDGRRRWAARCRRQ